jgi:hypothetical protein
MKSPFLNSPANTLSVLGNRSIYVQYPAMHTRLLLLEQSTARTLHPQRPDHHRHDKRRPLLRWRPRHPRAPNSHDLETTDQHQTKDGVEWNLPPWRLRLLDEYL